jgi:hypothetical protein
VIMMTASKTALGSLGLLCSLTFFLAACPATLDDRGACVASEGGTGPDVNSVDGGGVDPPVDPCVNTPTDPKCLDESTAFFVSAAANAAGADGSRAKPFATVTAALGAINDTRKRVYVCEGTYPEKVAVQKPVSILGGLACDWTKKGANPRIAPAKGVALSIVKTIGVTITDIDVDGSADSQLDGDSAIAVFVSESKAVLFRRVTLKAGAGTKGAAGANGDVSPNYTGALAPKGLDTSTSAAAEAPACGTCADGNFSVGGKGAAAMGPPPLPGKAMPTVGSNNAGGTIGGVCGDGKPGAPGTTGTAAPSADRPGSAKATGWDSPILAKKGTNGNPGQGGGGAGSNDTLGGGSGGCGGCGGTGGGPGANGGSSFALLSFDSDVAIENSTLTSSAGGSGGTGGKGQDGQIRGPAGGGVCSGGVGGHGAGGGGGGGGAGGHSAAIAHSGKAPTTTVTMLKPGVGGDVGPGGGAGTSTGNPGVPGNPGARGSSAEALPL